MINRHRLLLHLAYGNDPGQREERRGLGSGEHGTATKAGVACVFLLSLIGQDPLSLTFCTASLAFHMLMPTGPEEETCGSRAAEDKRLPLSLCLFLYLLSMLISPLFPASSPLSTTCQTLS